MHGPWTGGLLTYRRKGRKALSWKYIRPGCIKPLAFIGGGGWGWGGKGRIPYIHYALSLFPQPQRVKKYINTLQICPAISIQCSCDEKPVKKHFSLKFPRGNYKQEEEKTIIEIMKNTLTVSFSDSHLALEKYSAKGCILTGKRWIVHRRGSSLS